MKTSKKFWQLILAVALGILTTVAFAGCSSKPETKPAATSQAADESLAKIKSKGRLVVGINAEFAPFEFHTMSTARTRLSALTWIWPVRSPKTWVSSSSSKSWRLMRS